MKLIMKKAQAILCLFLLWQSVAVASVFRLQRNTSSQQPNCEQFCHGSHCDLPECDSCDTCKIVEVKNIQVKGSGGWQAFTFDDAFQTVPVVVILPNKRGGHPCTIRIKDVSKTGFRAVIVEPPGHDGPHAKQTVTYMAVTPGTHKLGGHAMNARLIDTSAAVSSQNRKCGKVSNSWEDVEFQSRFDGPPAIVAAIQTANNEKNSVPRKTSKPFLTVAAKDLTKDGVKLSLELSETVKRGGKPTKSEQIGFITMEAKTGEFVAREVDIKYAAVLPSSATVSGWGQKQGRPQSDSIPFGTDLGANPLVVGMQVTRNGGDGGWMRLVKTSAQKVDVTIDEDKSCDRDRKHTNEKVSIIAFSGPFSKR